MSEFSLEKYENRSVLQSNPLTEACKAMELYEGKLYYLALLEFNFRQDKIEKDIPLPELMIPTEVVLKVFGGNKSYYKRLRDAAGRLYNISFARDDKGRILLAKGSGDGLIEMGNSEFAGKRIFTSMEFSPRVGGLKFRFSEEVKDEIHKLLIKGGFTLIQGKTLFALSSMYSIRLIEMLLRFQNLDVNRRRGFILLKKDINDLKFDLNIIGRASYNNIAHLKQKILEPAKADINDNTPYTLDYFDIKKGRKIVALEFRLYYPKNNNTSEEIDPTDELISDREERKAREINITANVDNPDADIYDVLRRYDVGKIIARRLANKYDEKEIREKIRTAIAYRERHKVTNFPGLIYDLITGKYTVNVEQTSLFDEVEEKPKYTSAERKKIEKEQRAANKVRMEENKCRAPGEQVPLVDVPDLKSETLTVTAKPTPATEPVQTATEDKDKLSVSIETIKMFVDGGKAEKVVKELAKLAKKGISIDDVKNHSVDELKARYEAAEAAESAPEQEPETLENISDPEPSAAPEQNIFDEVIMVTPEQEAEGTEQEKILAQVMEEIRDKVEQLSKKEMQIIKDSVEKDKPTGRVLEMRLQQLDLDRYDAYLVVDEYLAK